MTRNEATHTLRYGKPTGSERHYALFSVALMAVAIVVLLVGFGRAAEALPPDGDAEAPLVRELYVPLKDFEALMEGQTDRVLLPRKEYDALARKARSPEGETPAPTEHVFLAANYQITVEDRRARIEGQLVFDLLTDELTALPLELAGAGLRVATLNGEPASMGQEPGGPLLLFVEGRGRHHLALHMVAPLITTAARQELAFTLPDAATGSLELTVPGDVELKSGAEVVRRVVSGREDGGLGSTKFALLPRPTPYHLVMTLNSHTRLARLAVLANSVVVDEVAETYERLHATVTLDVLHRAVDTFRFIVPEGFDITGVSTPDLANWTIEPGEEGVAVLRVKLRQETTGRVTLNLWAMKMPPTLEGWTMPRLIPLDVVGQTAVVGLLVDERLRATAITSDALVPIDTDVLRRALPASVFAADPGAPPIRPVVAWYAPDGSNYNAAADFKRPESSIAVTTNLLLQLEESRQVAHGGFAITPQYEKVFAIDFAAPPEWQIEKVTGHEGQPLTFERREAERVHVRLDRGIAPGERYRLLFEAVTIPPGWLGTWESMEVELPVFRLFGATSDVGALAIQAGRDRTLRPTTAEGLTPLDESMRSEYLSGVQTDLAYRYASQPYALTMDVERKQPRLTARSFTFATVLTDALQMRYEIDYTIEEARARELRFLLREDTPETIHVAGLHGLSIEEHTSGPVVDGFRPWFARLAEPAQGVVRLAVQFEQPLDVESRETVDIPIPRADGVAWQSGLVAVEGNEQLDIRLEPAEDTRRVDVGELSLASHVPGRRLLGAFGFVGDGGKLTIGVRRHPGYPLYSTIVQEGRLQTRLSTNGVAGTLAIYHFRTKAMYLEVTLPEESELWAAALDNEPVKPRRDAQRLLISLPSGDDTALRELRLFYRQSLPKLSILGRVQTAAPTLWTRVDPGSDPVIIPLADLEWRVILPHGHRMIGSRGTVTPEMAATWDDRGFDPTMLLFSPMLLGGKAAPPAAMESAQVRMAGLALDIAPDAADGFHAHDTYASEEMMAPTSESAPRAPMDESVLAEKADYRQQVTRSMQVADAPATGPPPPSRPMGQAAASPAPPPPPAPATPLARPGVSASEPEARAERRRIDGFRSLWINLETHPEAGDTVVTFRSLGDDPRLDLTMAEDRLFVASGWALAIAVGAVGLLLMRRTATCKVFYLLSVAAVANIAPTVPGWESLGSVAAHLTGPLLALALIYLLVGYQRCVVRVVSALCCRPLCARAVSVASAPSKTTGTLLFVVALALSASGPALAQTPSLTADGVTIHVVPPPNPPRIPDDALLVPYDPAEQDGPARADRLLIPYSRYVELWNAAYPDQKLTVNAPPTEFAIAGVDYRATLLDGENLRVEGVMRIDVYVEKPVLVPLDLGGVVLTGATLNNKPARLSLTAAPPMERQQQVAQQAARPLDDRRLALLHVRGKGRHTLEFTTQIRLNRQGGWRLAQAILPTAAAASVRLIVPDAETDLRLGELTDQRRHETTVAGQTIETTLGPGGRFDLQWRPKVAQGQVDRSLTATSQGVFDVQENGLRATWRVHLQFPHGRHDAFEIRVPSDYMVEAVEGPNVRGWDSRDAASADAGAPNADRRQTVNIELLKTAEQQETFTVRLLKTGAVGFGHLTTFDIPVPSISGAALHSGELMLRRSPLLNVRSTQTLGVTRTDLAAGFANQITDDGALTENPFAIRPLQAFRFTAEPVVVSLEASPVEGRVTASVHCIVKISEFERTLDARIQLNIEQRPIYQIEILLPDALQLDTVTAPGQYDWAETQRDGKRLLTVYSTTGLTNHVSILLEGSLPSPTALDAMNLPVLTVLNMAQHSTALAIQVDPAYDVQAVELRNCGNMLPSQFGWLNAENQRQTRLALYSGGVDFAGRLEFSLRQPDVRCETITNVQVTERAVEETIVLNYSINKAGIRTISFLLPAWMADSRIEAPVVQQKTVVSTGDSADAPLRVTIDLQEEQMNEYRVLIRNDRLLVPGQPYQAPIPTIETGQAQRQYVVLENVGGRDEIVVDSGQLQGLEVLSRQRPEWAKLASILGERMTEAYVIAGDVEPRLVFRSLQRTSLEMAGAMIGLAETRLVLDPHGGYRAEQVYFIDNKTEQFLDVELPTGAHLWTAQIFSAEQWEQKKRGAMAVGEPVKPTVVPGASDDRQVRIPLIKTEVGDLDYVIRLQYGGRVPPLRNFATLHFPLMRVVTIPVERSTVRLYLPESYRFYNWDGTMRLADATAVTKAVQSYNVKQTEKLNLAIQSGNPFEQARARRSSGIAQSLFGGFSSESAGGYGYSPSPSQPLPQSPARDDVRYGAPLADTPSGQVMLDNRKQLSTFYFQQQNDRAKNVVNETGRNWDASEIDRQTVMLGSQAERFNSAWLEQNALLVKETESLERKADDESGAYGSAKPSEQQMVMPSQSRLRADDGRAATSQAEALALNRGGRIAKDSFFEDIAGQQQMAQSRAAGEPTADPFGDSVPGSIAFDRVAPNGAYFMGGMGGGMGGGLPPGVDADQRDLASDVRRSAGQVGRAVPQTVAPDAMRQTLAASIMSLDVELPEHGVMLEFTAPQGKAEITASVVSNSLMQRAGRLSRIVAAIFAVAVLVFAARRGWFRWARGLVCAGTCLGLAALLFCVFPLPAVALAAVGFYILLLRIGGDVTSPAARRA